MRCGHFLLFLVDTFFWLAGFLIFRAMVKDALPFLTKRLDMRHDVMHNSCVQYSALLLQNSDVSIPLRESCCYGTILLMSRGIISDELLILKTSMVMPFLLISRINKTLMNHSLYKSGRGFLCGYSIDGGGQIENIGLCKRIRNALFCIAFFHHYFLLCCWCGLCFLFLVQVIASHQKFPQERELGPFWHFHETDCDNTWWTVLIFINNLYPGYQVAGFLLVQLASF